jgi:hypothetical protein
MIGGMQGRKPFAITIEALRTRLIFFVVYILDALKFPAFFSFIADYFFNFGNS